MSNSNVRTDINNALNLSDQESDSGSKHIEKYTLSRPGSSSSDHEKARTVALQNELQSVQNINQVIEGVLDSLDRARNNVEVWDTIRYQYGRHLLTHPLFRVSLELLTQHRRCSTLGLESYRRQNKTSGLYWIIPGKEQPKI